MNPINLQHWVESEQSTQRKIFRQAVHLILRAIAHSRSLAPLMVMKGGILLAIRYNNPRFTKDIDFSTPRKLQDVEIPALLNELGEAIAPISADNEYGVGLGIQSHLIKPPDRPNVSFPTLNIKIGYARRADRNQINKLRGKQSANVVEIDYSFNEWATTVERQPVDGGELSMYAYLDLIAEKLRSVLQQPLRKRNRFQDIYDLCLLLKGGAFSQEEKASILEKLYSASIERGLYLAQDSMRNPEVIQMSERGYYEALPALIDSAPPDFNESYKVVADFFEGLPWTVK